MEYGMEDFCYGMEWKKIGSMEYGNIVFHSIPYHALPNSIKIASFYKRLHSGWGLSRQTPTCDRLEVH